MNWQIEEQSLAWVRHKIASGGSKKGIPEAEGIFPSLEVFVPQVSRIASSKSQLAKKELFILAITSSIGLVSPDGALISSNPLSESQYPVTSPVIGDFNNDGFNDVIIVSAKGYHGFTLNQSLSIMGMMLCHISLQ